MIKYLFSILVLCSLATASTAQLVVQIDAGSRASYGFIQSLSIDKNGKCQYVKYDVSTSAIKDSSSFSITPTQLSGFLNKAESSGFFSLNQEYHKGVDGAGIFIALNKGGKKGSVDLKNTDLPAINSLIATLNTILESRKITIYYGQK